MLSSRIGFETDTKRHPTDLKHDAAKETVTRETEPKDEGTVETPQTPMRSEKIESGLCAVRGGAEEAKEASETKPPIPIENPRNAPMRPIHQNKARSIPYVGQCRLWAMLLNW